jgi:hypothetical protein
MRYAAGFAGPPETTRESLLSFGTGAFFILGLVVLCAFDLASPVDARITRRKLHHLEKGSSSSSAASFGLMKSDKCSSEV